ncbi:hypothetical protein ACQE32_18025 [Pantoea sp. FN0302]|uniref:hypothetical protein n=1 Tax=unclassified Pantoea TaxID=2630326 RepID=UPI003CEBF40B
MNKHGFSAALMLVLCVSCSDYQGSSWTPGEAIYPASSQGRIHGDERSPSQRYNDCLSASKKADSKAERSRCTERSQHPDPDYVGVTVPLHF